MTAARRPRRVVVPAPSDPSAECRELFEALRREFAQHAEDNTAQIERLSSNMAQQWALMQEALGRITDEVHAAKKLALPVPVLERNLQSADEADKGLLLLFIQLGREASRILQEKAL